ncbi:polyphosphate kinase 1 [Vibrio gangliei]|uniref:polyphosphate kinase 1 n=1 Tax=Vibrio gangliei TaxID=2077090 RepID=UPI000D015EFA|nr:polyphosphate kinase 1 [Vibrio gangliei]
MSSEKLYIEKELSWLSFNERVLQEAADKTVPLIERVRFLGIFSSNLDEFYKVRFADVKRRILISQQSGNGDGPKHLLIKMQSKVLKLNQRFDELYNELILEMARRRIFLVNESQLQESQQKWIRKYFHNEVLPHITPFLMNKDTDVLGFLKDEHSYLTAEIINGTEKNYALIDIPTNHLPRFIMVPEQKGKRRKTIILLDNIIRFCLDDIFKGFFEYDELNCYTMTMTRDAEYDLRHEVEHSLLEQMSEGVNQRLTAMPVRLVYQRDMPEDLLKYLCEKLKMTSYDSLIPGGRYHNFKDFTGFPNVGRDYLENKPLPALKCADFAGYPNSFEAISAQDILLYYPYHTFDHITELVRQASFDPKVISIKINIYRVAKNSKLMNSLMDAVHNKKKVTVVVELQARFDEEANIEWAKLLTDAGVHVIFGAPGLKIHSKLLLITRREEGEFKRYAHIGTGNFHEKTARIYTDFSLLTADPLLTAEVRNVFGYIENPYRPVRFNQLMVSPRNSRQQIYKLIDSEIALAKEGKKAGLTIKVNNLVDKGLVSKLYGASNAGVKIRMIVRGMCSLVPGIAGVSENINIISIIDRFLEHPRVFIAENDGDPKVYISSADWMTRNLDYRIEVATPIHSPRLKQRIIDIINIHFIDTVKARIIDKEMSNTYVPRGNRKKVRSQIAIYDYLKQIERKSQQKSD